MAQLISLLHVLNAFITSMYLIFTYICFFGCIVSIFAALFISCYSFKATCFLLLCSCLTSADTGVS